MLHAISESDVRFRHQFESGRVSPGSVDHRAHLKLAYIFLVESDTEGAYSAMSTTLRSFLARHGIDAERYHDTMTRAWVMAVRHFMDETAACASADEFIDRNPRMLDSRIMLTHYSAEVLFSNEARKNFVQPDIESIPGHDDTVV